MTRTFANLVNTADLQGLVEAHYRASGMPNGIIDAIDGSVIAGAGWQDICTKFHRVHPETCTKCVASDLHINKHIATGHAFSNICSNGMRDIGIPIMVASQHMATIFLGQFFYENEKPDREFFLNQAKQYGFDPASYLAALDRVPTFSQDRTENTLAYNTALASFLGELATKTLRLMQDNENRRRTEKELALKHAQLRTLIDAAPLPIFFATADGDYRDCNVAFEQFTATSRPEIIGAPIPKVLGDIFTAPPFTPAAAHPLDTPSADAALADTPTAGMHLACASSASAPATAASTHHHTPVSHRFETTYRSHTGSTREVIVHSALLPGADSTTAGMVGIITDISERKEMEQRLRDAEHHLTSVIDSMPSMILGADGNGNVTLWNKQAEQNTGISRQQACGQPLATLIPRLQRYLPAKDACNLDAAVHHRGQLTMHDGEPHYEDILVSPLEGCLPGAVMLRVDDVTERTRLEGLLLQTEKMHSLGSLAAGMAHEINNPLGGISGAATNISRRLSPALASNRKAAEEHDLNLEKLEAYLNARNIPAMLGTILDASNRASTIVRSMLDFSRPSAGRMSSMPVEELIESALGFASSDYDLKKQYDFKRIRILRDFAPLQPIICVASEIEQVLLNLFKNAAHALADKTFLPPEAASIIIRTYAEKDAACIDVEDNGPGLPADMQRRIFEPFFTTKAPGRGTGLGLSVCYSIITRNHHGSIDVTSIPGQLTRFTLRLPYTHNAQTA